MTLRIAVPNKGALSQAATDILRESGYRQRSDSKELALVDSENDVEFFYLRPRDIALYVGEGTLDVGITGRDLLRDSGAKAEEVMSLEFGRSTFRFAGPKAEFDDAADLSVLSGKRIATSYTGIVQTFLDTHGIQAEVVRLDGAVETSIQLGVADVIADVVETGSTLRQAGLEVFGEAVLVARGYVMMDYDIEESRVSDAVALTPGLEGPTISPLRREGWVAVRAMVPRAGSQRLMDELYDIGARAILLTDIHACRL